MSEVTSELIAASEAPSLLQKLLDRQLPDDRGRFGPFGGRYVPETLVPALERLEQGVRDILPREDFQADYARELGIPTMRPVKQGSPVLTEVDGPLRGNLGGDRTVGHFQFDPATTPSCGPGAEGHYCPQDAPSAQAQRLHFFHTALQDAAPEIIDPLE